METKYILHIVPKLELGGIGIMLLNYYRYIDREKYVFDIVVHGQDIGELESDFKNLGSTIYRVTPKKESYKQYKEDLYRILKGKTYYAIHAHQNLSSFIPLKIAKKCGYQRRIAHSHAYIKDPTKKEKLQRDVFSFLTMRYANYLLYCGEYSRQWVYGKKMTKNMLWIPNGIEIEKFNFSKSVRSKLRHQYHIAEDTIVLMTISRLSKEKNIAFVLKMLQLAKEKHLNLHYVNIGDGELSQQLHDLVVLYGIEDYVTFLGAQKNTAPYYNMADCYLLPSLFEAFPVGAIEAQANGCPSILSSNVSDEVVLNDHVLKLEISNTENVWLDQALQYGVRVESPVSSSVASFDIKRIAVQLESWYDSID